MISPGLLSSHVIATLTVVETNKGHGGDTPTTDTSWFVN